MLEKLSPTSIHTYCKRVIAFMLLLMQAQFAISQPGGGQYVAEKKRLELKSGGNLYSTLMTGSVGGVDFSATAAPDSSVIGSGVNLKYDKNQPDGQRLAVTIDSRTYYPSIYDWELFPIAKFADDEFTACFTALDTTEVSDTSYTPYNYHEAFYNTLLGVRLRQADFYTTLADARVPLTPLDTNGNFILGSGEVIPSYEKVFKNQKKLRDLNRKLIDRKQHCLSWGTRSRGWILTDAESEITFGVNDSALVFSGAPYYHFWTKETCYNLYGEKCEDSIDSIYLCEGATKYYIDNFQIWRAANPLVSNATFKVMYFASFFNYIALQNNNNWASFIKSINKADKKARNKYYVETPLSPDGYRYYSIFE